MLQCWRKFGDAWYVIFICASIGTAHCPVLNTSSASPSNTAFISAHLLNTLLIFTTIHAQDFQDIEGDRATGRVSLPIVYPSVSRASMAGLLPCWSIFASLFWGLRPVISTGLVVLGACVGGMFYMKAAQRCAQDKHAYRAYNVSSCFCRELRNLSTCLSSGYLVCLLLPSFDTLSHLRSLVLSRAPTNRYSASIHPFHAPRQIAVSIARTYSTGNIVLPIEKRKMSVSAFASTQYSPHHCLGWRRPDAHVDMKSDMRLIRKDLHCASGCIFAPMVLAPPPPFPPKY